MTAPHQSNPSWPACAHDSAAVVAAMADDLRQAMQAVAGLVHAGRRVDVTGLDRAVGLLCAKVLDLPAPAGRAAQDGLAALAVSVAALDAVLRAHPPQPPSPRQKADPCQSSSRPS